MVRIGAEGELLDDSASGAATDYTPRQISLPVKLTVLFARIWSQLGAAFVAIGLIAAAFLAPIVDIESVTVFDTELAKAQGQIIRIEGTSSHVNNKPIMAYHFEFELEEGRRDGASYRVRQDLEVGDPVEIEYVSGQPEYARIVGMSYKEMPIWVGLIFLIFPMMGMIFFTIGYRRGRKELKMLRWGVHASGTFKESIATMVRVNRQYVHKMRFEFSGGDGRAHICEHRSHRTDLIDEAKPVTILYDPIDPESAVVLELVAGQPRIGTSGTIEGVSSGKAFAASLTPSLALASLVFMLVMLMR